MTAEKELPVRIAEALHPLEGVRLAYFFGSRSTGKARADSDLDLAVRYERQLAAPAREQLRRRIVAVLTDELGRVGEQADVVDLDRVDSAVAFRAIRDGACVLARSRSERTALEVEIMRRYDDEAPRRALFRAAAIRAAERLGEQGNGRG